jgi:hypothetical protein
MQSRPACGWVWGFGAGDSQSNQGCVWLDHYFVLGSVLRENVLVFYLSYPIWVDIPSLLV